MLSPSGHSLYTIAQFRLDQVLKSQPSKTSGYLIEILFPGGTLKREDGSILRYGLHTGDDIPIDLKQRYLLFLIYDKALDSYDVVKHWKLENGVTIAVDLLESQKDRIANTGIQGTPESVLVKRLTDLIY